MSDDWAEYRGNNQKKRWNNYEKSVALLDDYGAEYRVCDPGTGHLKIRDEWSFWPTTGKFYNEKTGEKGRGVFNLLKLLDVT